MADCPPGTALPTRPDEPNEPNVEMCQSGAGPRYGPNLPEGPRPVDGERPENQTREKSGRPSSFGVMIIPRSRTRRANVRRVRITLRTTIRIPCLLGGAMDGGTRESKRLVSRQATHRVSAEMATTSPVCLSQFV
ncbi:hypothetical protein VTN02DRAFT_244 [Thermoascus thermophilus]